MRLRVLHPLFGGLAGLVVVTAATAWVMFDAGNGWAVGLLAGLTLKLNYAVFHYRMRAYAAEEQIRALGRVRRLRDLGTNGYRDG